MSKNFFMVYRRQDSCGGMIELVRASGTAAMVFLGMCNLMDGMNNYRGTNRLLADGLGINEASVSRAMRNLVEWGYVVERKEKGRRVIVLNPDVVWGNASDMRSWVRFATAGRLGDPPKSDSQADLRTVQFGTIPSGGCYARRPRNARGLVAEGGDGLPAPQEEDNIEAEESQEES